MEDDGKGGLFERGGMSRMQREIRDALSRMPIFRNQPHLYELREGLAREEGERLVAWCREQGWNPTLEFRSKGGNWTLRFAATDGVQAPPSRRGPPTDK